ncbi:GNAT family N-acetyltransferase [Clostridium sp. 'White wine YQ']|uniref:GNAT family N-acetyltransferase n=1 Tax=Clostridium sp. 'White wine YQ' TaxID=3027474 RepID=UPI002366D513|nr:GNAT family protein [Clostridium sp. 'White wine YQ']MDD7795361.1 GNAT family protein [Clostridium sp. 'White wine YQ']
MSAQVGNCPSLETTRLLLRKLSITDVDELFEVFSDEETTYHVPREKHENKNVTYNHLKNLIKGMNEGRSLVWSVIDKVDNRIIGTVSCYFKLDKAASIGSVISRQYWGRGIASEALNEVIKFGFDRMEFIRIEGKCEASNIASEKVLKKLGMTYEGTLRKEVIIKGQPRDAKVYSILIEEFRTY